MQHTFTISEYYEILDLQADASVEEIKKAYRKKARLYHPDVNNAGNAKDLFIVATEAYEFLIAYQEKIRTDEKEFRQAMEDWKLYRQERTRAKARAYARTSYNSFRNSKFYRSTRILDGTSIIFSFIISVLVIVYTVYGYVYRLRNPVPGLEKPSIFTFVMLLLLGLTFFTITFIYLKAYLETNNKKKKRL